jgi:uncharacterized membrane protein
MTAWIWAVGRMLGLGTAAGVRASLTLAMIGVLSRLEWGTHVVSHFNWLESRPAIISFIVLAIIESTFDKVPKLDRLQDRLIMPARIAFSAIAGAATIGHGLAGLFVGLAVGLLGGWFGQWVKHAIRPRSTTSDAVVALISLTEDLFAFFAAAATAAIGVVGYGVFTTAMWLFYRITRHKRTKYKGLRVLR